MKHKFRASPYCVFLARQPQPLCALSSYIQSACQEKK